MEMQPLQGFAVPLGGCSTVSFSLQSSWSRPPSNERGTSSMGTLKKSPPGQQNMPSHLGKSPSAATEGASSFSPHCQNWGRISQFTTGEKLPFPFPLRHPNPRLFLHKLNPSPLFRASSSVSLSCSTHRCTKPGAVGWRSVAFAGFWGGQWGMGWPRGWDGASSAAGIYGLLPPGSNYSDQHPTTMCPIV